jgi:hypothetical protein
MTQSTFSKLKNDLNKMNRAQLVNAIWELSNDEMQSFEDVLTLAKESEIQLKKRLKHILTWFEHLAK